MTQFISCPNDHNWEFPEELALTNPAMRGVCPLCGEPPPVDAEVRWVPDQLFLLLLSCCVTLGIIFCTVGLALQTQAAIPQSHALEFFWVGYIGAMLFFSWLFGLYRFWPFYRSRDVAAVSRAMGLRYSPFFSKELAAAHPAIRTRAGKRSKHFVFGRFVGSSVVVLDHWSGLNAGRSETVAVFPDRILGLPNYSGLLSKTLIDAPSKQLWSTVARNQPRPVSSAGHYQGGWAWESCGGVVIVYQLGCRVRPESLPLFIGVAWRIRQLILEQVTANLRGALADLRVKR